CFAELLADAVAQYGRVVLEVQVPAVGETLAVQHCDQCGSVRGADLVRLDRLSRGDQFIAGGDYSDHGPPADLHGCETAGCDDGNFRGGQYGSGAEHLGALPVIRASRMNELPP